ncbi:McrB family protein [Epilithonimonas hominis]|uniref:McrB family protein n=1 Tax=Epilithonimonas hominis TaxID=420404 RepID=UPI001FEAE465|nr:AAA family ATPase [Epilithonimonas hominis]
MKTYPNSFKERNEINLRHGIKSSLGEIKELFALLYTLYLSDNKSSSITYSKEVNAPNTQIEIQDALLASAKNLFGALVVNDANFKNAINGNPLFKSQIESLQVTLELFWKLAKVTFVNNPGENTRERTGGKRFDKKLEFSTNLILLDNVLSERDNSVSDELKELLYNWILKTPNYTPDVNLYKKIQTTLTIFSEETQFKIRKDDNTELYFQQEGIYEKLINGNTVNDKDNVEPVGPFRILKSFVKSDLHRFIKEDGNNGFNIKNVADLAELQSYNNAVETSLNLIPKRTVIYQEEQPNNQVGDVEDLQNIENLPHQIIFYGSPGTGKSRAIELKTNGHNRTRTTFHPETDYHSFVGSYKPVMNGSNIEYKFVPQAFTKAYCEAWKNPDEQHFLIIEEINRGNCAQIFGDIFQCLDRDDTGKSKYEIDCNEDLANHLKEAFTGTEIVSDKIILPSNLYILATMNTSDQSLFPMDSAFKRRWDWEFVPVNYEDAKQMTIEIDDTTKYNWGHFIEIINPAIKNLTGSEDKQLGNRFVNPKDGNITFDQFRSKVLFYLWSEVYKDEYGTQSSIFKYEYEENNPIDFQFGELYNDNATEVVKAFLKFNGIEP